MEREVIYTDVLEAHQLASSCTDPPETPWNEDGRTQ